MGDHQQRNFLVQPEVALLQDQQHFLESVKRPLGDGLLDHDESTFLHGELVILATRFLVSASEQQAQ